MNTSNLRQVWAVVYDSDTPQMDGTHPALRMAEQTREQAERNLAVVQARSARPPKRNLRIETRFVSEWTTAPPAQTAPTTDWSELSANSRESDDEQTSSSHPAATEGGA